MEKHADFSCSRSLPDSGKYAIYPKNLFVVAQVRDTITLMNNCCFTQVNTAEFFPAPTGGNELSG
jgi:hypothetical protein